jgi:hypothetical protein
MPLHTPSAVCYATCHMCKLNAECDVFVLKSFCCSNSKALMAIAKTIATAAAVAAVAALVQSCCLCMFSKMRTSSSSSGEESS